jgi:multidrug efflux system membrane fusion protein
MRAAPTPIRFPFAFALGLGATLLAGCNGAEPVPEPVRPAVVARPVAAAATTSAWFSGDVRARHESQLGFRVGGKISRRRVDVGARVQAGDVLVELDPADLGLELDAARAAVASAQADATLAQAERDRFAALLDRQLISASQFEAQDTGLAAAQARLQQAQAQLAVTRNQLGYARLSADRAGTVTSIQAEAGQVVAPGQVVATVAQDGDREVEIALPEGQLGDYPTGTAAVVSLWSAPGTQLAGTLREVAPDADSASRSYRARVSIADPDGVVALGQTARVRFDRAGAAGRLAIPLTALHVRDDDPAVWLFDPGTGQVALRPVEVATYREDTVELAGGLEPAQWLVVAGVHRLHEGQVVRAIDADGRPIPF